MSYYRKINFSNKMGSYRSGDFPISSIHDFIVMGEFAAILSPKTGNLIAEFTSSDKIAAKVVDFPQVVSKDNKWPVRSTINDGETLFVINPYKALDILITLTEYEVAISEYVIFTINLEWFLLIGERDRALEIALRL